MDFLADENVEPVTVQWLRSLGHDVFSILEASRGVSDKDVLMRAVAQNRIVITYDLDFGELAFRQRISNVGIILLRLSDPKATGRLARLQGCWGVIAARAPGNFIVVTDRKIRVRPMGSGT